MVLFLIFVLILKGCLSFYQNEYRLINERSEIVRYNKRYSDNVTFALSPFNRTTRAFNLHAHLLVECASNITVVSQFYKFLSNEYRYFPVQISLNLCEDILEKGLYGFDEITKHTNVKGCPLKKGWHYVNNFIPDYTKWPPHVPYGKYKSVVEFYHQSDFLLELHWYGKIEEIIKWKK